MAKKFYAIKEGFDSKSNVKVENVIVNTWPECLEYVKGVKGAKYKSFEDIKSAEAYLGDTKKLLKKGVDKYPMDCMHIYVDGSYNVDTKRYSYGLVAVKDNIVEYMESGSPMDTTASNIRQIAGELEGATKAVEYALNSGSKKIVLFHDYEGIFHHATGSWERRDKSSELYYEKMNGLFKKGIEVIFVKVDSHTGDLYNELVDELCKKELGIKSDNVVDKWLSQNELYVSCEELKEMILKLTYNKESSIIVKRNSNVNRSLGNSNSFVSANKVAHELLEMVNRLPDEKKIEILKYAKYIENQ